MPLDNRESATLILFAALVILALFGRGFRRAAGDFLKALANWRILTLFAIYFAYCVGVVFAAHQIGLWHTNLLKDTVILVLFTGIPMLMNKQKDGKQFFITTIKDTFALAAILAFYVGLAPLPLWGELILQVVATILVGVSLVAKRNPEHGKVERPASVLLGIIGLFLIIYTTVKVVSQANDFDFKTEGYIFAMAVWLPLALIPLIYSIAYFVNYEVSSKMLKHFNDKQQPPRRVRFALLVGLRFSLWYSAQFIGKWRSRLGQAKGFREGLVIMRDFRRTTRQEREAKRAAARRLVEMAGVEGTDDEGRRLDQREFTETKDALDRFWYAQLGWHRNQLGRFVARLAKPEVNFFGDTRLPPGAEVHFILSEDKQKWFAWRRTVTGWVFAVAGLGSDLDTQWQYDGAEPPTSWPDSERPAPWASDTVEGENLHWRLAGDQ